MWQSNRTKFPPKKYKLSGNWKVGGKWKEGFLNSSTKNKMLFYLFTHSNSQITKNTPLFYFLGFLCEFYLIKFPLYLFTPYNLGRFPVR